VKAPVGQVSDLPTSAIPNISWQVGNLPHLVPLLALLAFTAMHGYALETSKLKPHGYVNDFASVLDPRGAQALEAYCTQLDAATGAQLAVVLVPTLDGEPIEDAANRLFHEWGIGKKGKDEGILILLAVKDRKQRAEIGYGLEGDIPDGFAGGVLRGIRPILAQGNYSGALLAAAQQFGSRIAQAKGVQISGVPPPSTYVPAEPKGIPWLVIIIGLVILFSVLRRGGGGGGGGGGGFLTGIILGNLLGGGRRDGWGGGGFGGGGGGGGGGGFGGFGGGDSGGGGASSDW
jgi:uncharacterized protein